MTQYIQEAINEDRKIIVEAGTGTGKTLAYLIPAIKWAVTY
ncbi:ATP-dependent helicase, DinG family [Fusobacterium vincentii ATCC 49256]|nr:ATP-dependent helicase, DinG family [Fusobacterium vincentii ATCC 49256]